MQQIWTGWTSTPTPTMTPANRALTWAEWRARQQGVQLDAQRRPEEALFSERELARLSFVRWLRQTGRLDL
jgi:hypothetical protein